MNNINQYDMEKLCNMLKKELDDERYAHTLGVMYTSGALAMCYGYDMEKAMVTGLLHDCAKCIPNKKKIKMCEKNNIEISPWEEQNPFLLHSKLGAFLAKNQYGIEDEEILNAILYHTTGRADMGILEKITYISDYIEPRRAKAPRLNEIRKAAFEDMDRALRMIMEDTLYYLKNSFHVIDPITQEAYEFYKK